MLIETTNYDTIYSEVQLIRLYLRPTIIGGNSASVLIHIARLKYNVWDCRLS